MSESTFNLYNYYLVDCPENEHKKSITDIPASFHRTNSQPLDLSSALEIKDDTTSPETVIEGARAHGASYNGQIITIDKAGKVRTFVLHKSDHTVPNWSIPETTDKNSADYGKILENTSTQPYEELAYKSYVDSTVLDEKSERLRASLAEELRATNTEASIIAGPNFRRDNNNELQWSYGSQVLTYNSTAALNYSAEISTAGQNYVKTDNESITSADGNTYYLVTSKSENNNTSFAEFRIDASTKIPISELAIFGQEFSDTNSDGCFYIYDSLCYVDADKKLLTNDASVLGTVTTSISAETLENSSAGWYISNNNNPVQVDSLLQVMSNIANLRDTLKAVQNNFITISATDNANDTCLCIDLDTFSTKIQSSY